MNNYSLETLRKIEQNADWLIELGICNKDSILSRDTGRYFTSSDEGDYSRLGSCISNNTNLKTLYVELENVRLSATERGFFGGIKQNSSIQELKINGYSENYYPVHNPIGEVGCELLKTLQNNRHLTALHIWCCDISNAEESITAMLRSCTNLKMISLTNNGITDEVLLPMVAAIRGHSSLQDLYLWKNMICNAGCGALATLLESPNSNLRRLDLSTNHIGILGAHKLADSLTNNTKLKRLYLESNQIDQSVLENSFSRVLCDKSSLNATYSSNHTLSNELFGGFEEEGRMGKHLASLLKLNKGSNKKYVAIKKLLLHHPNIDVDQLFEWGSKDDRNLMALPYVVAWFDRAGEAVEHDEESVVSDDSSNSDHSSSSSEEEGNYDYQVEERKLTAIYEFALAMPLLFIPNSNKKRKSP